MAKPSRATTPQRLILDSGAVIALSCGDQRARAFLTRALELDAAVEIPVVVVAETLRGGPRDAAVHRVLKAVDDIPETGEDIGRIAGHLQGAARMTAVADALVVAQAVAAGGALVITGDPEDLQRLAAPHPEVWIQSL